MQFKIETKHLANIERQLQKRIGGAAAREFMERTSNSAIDKAETATTAHLASKYQISPVVVEDHIYYRRRGGGKSSAVVAWSPSRDIPIKKLNPEQTSTGVRWRFAGRKRSRKAAYIDPDSKHVFRRKSAGGGSLVPRLPIEKVKGPIISWDSAWQRRVEEIIEDHFNEAAHLWLDEYVA